MNALMLMGFPSDRIYLVLQTASYYALLYMGNASFGVREKQITDYPDPLTDAAIEKAGPKDLWIEKRAVTSCALTMKQCRSTQLPNCGSLTLKTADGKKRKFIILDTVPLQELRSFFPATEEVNISRSAQRQSAREAYGKALESARNKKEWNKYRGLYWTSLVLSIAAFAAITFLPLPLPLWLLVAINLAAIAFALVLLFMKPQWYCINDSSMRNVYGIPMFSLLLPLFLPLIGLGLFSLQGVDYLSMGRFFLIHGAFSLVFGMALWYFAPERKADSLGLLPLVLLVVLFGYGISGSINLMDICQGYDRSEVVTVTALHISHSSKGGDSYHVTTGTADSEE